MEKTYAQKTTKLSCVVFSFLSLKLKQCFWACESLSSNNILAGFGVRGSKTRAEFRGSGITRRLLLCLVFHSPFPLCFFQFALFVHTLFPAPTRSSFVSELFLVSFNSVYFFWFSTLLRLFSGLFSTLCFSFLVADITRRFFSVYFWRKLFWIEVIMLFRLECVACYEWFGCCSALLLILASITLIYDETRYEDDLIVPILEN